MYEKFRKYVLRYGFDDETFQLCSDEVQKTNINLARILAHFVIFINAALIILFPYKIYNILNPFLIFVSFITLILTSKKRKIPYKHMINYVYAELLLLLVLSILGRIQLYSYDDILLIVIYIMCFPILTVGMPVALFIMLAMCSVGFGFLRATLDPSASVLSNVVNAAVFSTLCICMHYIVGRMWYRGLIAKKNLETAERKIELALESSEIYTWEYDIVNRRSIQSTTESRAMDAPPIINNFPENAILLNYIAPESYSEYRRIHKEVEAGRTEASAEIGYLFPNGDVKWRRVKYLTIFNGFGDPVRAIGCSSDITMEVALRNAKETVERHLSFAIENSDQAEGSLIAAALFNVNKGYFIKYDFKKFNESYNFDGISINQAGKIISRSIPDEEDRKKWFELYKSDNLMREYYRGRERLLLDTKRIDQSGRQILARDVVRLRLDQLTGDILAIAQLYDIDEIKIRERMLNRVIDDNYDFIAKINTSDGSYVVYSDYNKKHDILPRKGDNFEKAVKGFFNSLKDKEGLSDVVQKMNLEQMKQYLENHERFELLVRTNFEKEGNRYKKISYYYLDSQRTSILFAREDVTKFIEQEQKKNEALSKALVEAKKANEAKSDFLSKMSHDIRTPMNVILNMAALAIDDIDNKEMTTDYLEKITVTGKYLLSLINDILDVSKIESGKLELKEEIYNCEDFNTFITTITESLCKKNGVEFVVKLEEMNVSVYTDITRFNQIFLNLLSNAVKFTPEGGRIEFIGSIHYENEHYLMKEYIVRDNGIGMSEEFMQNMFNPFTQESSEITSELEGTGLGLSIVKSIVDKMGGTVSVKSKKGEGSEFTVRIRMKIAEKADKTILQKCKALTDCNCLKGYNILLVEDHPLNAEIALKILQKNGASVFRAENGLVALNAFSESETGYFDAILMDIRMPIMGGLEATQKIRSLNRPDAISVPIIAMSANAFDEDKVVCKEIGINEYLTKPIEAKRVVETVKRLANKD